MLVVTRQCGESIVIVPAGATANSSSVELRIRSVTDQAVEFAIRAPDFFRVLRRPRDAEPEVDAESPVPSVDAPDATLYR